MVRLGAAGAGRRRGAIAFGSGISLGPGLRFIGTATGRGHHHAHQQQNAPNRAIHLTTSIVFGPKSAFDPASTRKQLF
jgi:hypothetical protein